MALELGDLLGPDAGVRDVTRGWDIGGGEGLVAKGCDGPLWVARGALWFSDAGHSRRLAWTPGRHRVDVVHEPTGKAFGAALDRHGGLVQCEVEGRRVTRIDPAGRITVVADAVAGRPLAGPDDVALGPDGAVWFTDLRPAFPPAPPGTRSAVYRVADDHADPVPVLTGIEPGGLAFSPDGARLYVSDMAGRRLLALDVASGNADHLAPVLGDRPTVPQGLAVDELGNVYCGGPGGIWVTEPDGHHVGVIRHPASSTTNLAFGGDDRRTLFFTTLVGLGMVEMAVAGARLPGDDAPTWPGGWADRRPIAVERRIERHHRALDAVIAPGTEIEELGSGGVLDDLGGGPHTLYGRSLEGLVWDATEGCLLLSDIGNDRRLRWSPDDGFSTRHPHTNHTNGATLDNDGALISAEHSGRRRISRLARDGTYSVVADSWNGRPLARPNDVVVRSDGNLYFTCPWWDFGTGETCDQPYATFFRVTPTGQVVLGPPGLVAPNGLAFTPDEHRLYVNDSAGTDDVGPNITVYDVDDGGAVDWASARLFFRFSGSGPGRPDGMKVDQAGHVFCGGPGGLWVLSPGGEHLGTIVHGATQVNNLAFGGPDWRTLYFCSWSALFRIPVRIPGVPVPRGAPG
jgi:gluconolactonase